ncbi:MAG: homoserine kinase, partial [Bifidobacteriaceae bacterium]|nr:homoserine kinase [Bifidobacteriaceae bacterium]
GYHAGAVRIVCHNHIPQARGMGSSAEAIVAAVSAAYALSHDSIQRDEIFALAASYEGHPDNVAPAVYGGFTISWFENVFHTVNYEVSRELQASIFIPDFELSTEQARRALPKTVAYSDALYNLSRSALLPAALRPEIAASSAKKSELLFVATQDALHQPYRKSLMPLSWALVEGLRKQGIAAAISGAGPCVIALYFGDMPIMDMARQAGMGEHWRALHVPINNTGVQIEVQ